MEVFDNFTEKDSENYEEFASSVLELFNNAFLPEDEKSINEVSWPEDVKQIQYYLYKNVNEYATPGYIEQKYRQYCENVHAAGWLDPDEDLLSCFVSWLQDNK